MCADVFLPFFFCTHLSLSLLSLCWCLYLFNTRRYPWWKTWRGNVLCGTRCWRYNNSCFVVFRVSCVSLTLVCLSPQTRTGGSHPSQHSLFLFSSPHCFTFLHLLHYSTTHTLNFEPNVCLVWRTARRCGWVPVVTVAILPEYILLSLCTHIILFLSHHRL